MRQEGKEKLQKSIFFYYIFLNIALPTYFLHHHVLKDGHESKDET